MSGLKPTAPGLDVAGHSHRPLAWRRYLGITFAYGALFLALFRLSSILAFSSNGSLWYPAAGVRLALLLLFGGRLVPGIVIAEVTAISVYGLLWPETQYSDWVEVLQVASSPIAYGLASFVLVHHVRLDPRLRHVRDVIYLLMAALTVPLVGALTSRFAQLLLGNLPAEEALWSTLIFWTGDTIGILMMAPLVLLGYGFWIGEPPLERARLRWGLLAFDLALTWIFLWILRIFPAWFELKSQAHWYLAFLPIIWISFRHGLPGSVTGILGITCGAAWFFQGQTDLMRLQELQTLVLALSIASLLMGAIVSKQQTTEDELKVQNLVLGSIRQELEEKNRELERKNAELERFAYTVSHDLKSPLITIQGFLGLLLQDIETGDSARIQHDIERIRAASSTMADLLDALLELSRIGRVIHTLEKLSMCDLAHEVADQLAVQIAESGVRLEIAPDLPAVLGERPRLYQVLQNLVENAVKFTAEQPEPRVKIGWSALDERIAFYVRDNGIGIDPRYRERIFGLFDQLDQGRGGSGVGLALVKRIVEEHGGRIWVESGGVGQGSTFYFTLAHVER